MFLAEKPIEGGLSLETHAANVHERQVQTRKS
jgi:hypothetical protein